MFMFTGYLSAVSFGELIHARGSKTIVSCTSNRQDNKEGFPGKLFHLNPYRYAFGVYQCKDVSELGSCHYTWFEIVSDFTFQLKHIYICFILLFPYKSLSFILPCLVLYFLVYIHGCSFLIILSFLLFPYMECFN